MKTCLRAFQFMLLVLLSHQQFASPFGEMESKASFDSFTSNTELNAEQPEILYRDCIDSKTFSSSSSTNLLLVEEVEKKKTKKKSTPTAHQRGDNPLLIRRSTPVKKVGVRFILINIPFYKLFHSWKVDLL